MRVKWAMMFFRIIPQCCTGFVYNDTLMQCIGKYMHIHCFFNFLKVSMWEINAVYLYCSNSVDFVSGLQISYIYSFYLVIKFDMGQNRRSKYWPRINPISLTKNHVQIHLTDFFSWIMNVIIAIQLLQKYHIENI